MVQLDVLRGLAILLVLFAHFGGPPAGRLEAVLGYLRHLGPSGVDLFFVLSGFLVGGLLFDELARTGGLAVRRFLVRRAFKIWPSYFVFVAFIGAWLLFHDHRSLAESGRLLVPNLLHVQNYFGSAREHTWSLAVEEHFYLALPALLAVLAVRRLDGQVVVRALPGLTLAVLIACAGLRIHAYASLPPYNPHFATHLRIDSLLLGVLLAHQQRFAPQRLAFARTHRGAVSLLAGALLLAVPAVITAGNRSPLIGAVVFPMLYLGYGGLLLVMVQAQPGSGWLGRRLRGPGARLLAAIGVFSYPIYLWHLDGVRPAAKLIRHFPGWLPGELAWGIGFVLFAASAVATGVVFAVLIERPALALRERWFPRRQPAAREDLASGRPAAAEAGG